MHEMSTSERGLSETLSLVFMAILVAVAALLLVASLTGVISNLLLKPALFSVQVIQFNTSPGGAHIIGVFHQQGDSVDLNGTSQKGGTAIVAEFSPEIKWVKTMDIKEPVKNTYPSIKDILAKFFDTP